jgi:hypothetical protein
VTPAEASVPGISPLYDVMDLTAVALARRKLFLFDMDAIAATSARTTRMVEPDGIEPTT